MPTRTLRRDPDQRGYFGEFGGRYVPETLVEPVEELERAYLEVRDDPAFAAELNRLLKHYVGRPTPVYETARLAMAAGGARIFLKREDPTHTAAHTNNNALGHALPYDSLPQLRQALFAAHPHFMRLDQIAPGKASDIDNLAKLGGKADKAPLLSAVPEFYLTNSISRASAIMAECSALANAAAKTAAE